MRIFVVAVCALYLSGCGRYADTFQRLKPGSTTQITFTTPRIQNQKGEIQSFATLTGGALVYAVDANEAFRRGGKKLTDETAGGGTNWTIPTSTYIFLGIGWSGANFGGTVYCGQTPPITLNGSSTVVGLVLDQNNCGSPPFVFSGANAVNQPKVFMIASCTTVSGVTMGVPCGTAGGAVSANVSMPEYRAFDGEIIVENGTGGSNSIESSCISPSNTPTTTNARVPTGTGTAGDPFVIGVNTYNSGGCTGFTSKSLYGFAHSLFNAGNTSFSRFEINGSAVFPSVNPVLFGTSASNTILYLQDL